MDYQQKVFYTFCAYLHDGYGAKKFSDAMVANTSDNFFAYLKNNFFTQIDKAKSFVKDLEKANIKYKCLWEEGYPKNLKELPNPPVILFYKGNFALLDKEIVTIVGTRKCTSLGEKYAKDFTRELCRHYVIASGLAFGIDRIANEVSSEEKDRSIAVLPGSLVTPHPYSNKKTFDKILSSGGLILSEYPLTSDLAKGAFVVRNRILAGISKGVLLIESPIHGGSMITCKIAQSINSQVYAIPANIEYKTFEGNNDLIKRNVAELVNSPSDILKDDNKLAFTNIKKNLSYEEEMVLDAIGLIEEDFDSICLNLQGKISFERIYDIMLNLELSGIITRTNTGRYQIN